MTDFLNRRGLVLRTDLLGVWDAWLTPIFEPKRYRTWFFVASLPSGQVTRDVSTESSSVTWLPARVAADQADAGELALMPPTYLTSMEVGGYATPEEVLDVAASRSVEMFTPAVEPLGDGVDALDAGPAAAPGRGPAAGMTAWSGGRLRVAGPVPARPEPRDDDARRHQHLDPARARRLAVGRRRPRADRGRAPRPADRGLR